MNIEADYFSEHIKRI